ncbi:MAG: SAM-dependent methyltransferase [Calothrix sp. SM1_5_4]|nr:SAM-dependent methyltransferase [Calothrix sp. SM1_5_4]
MISTELRKRLQNPEDAMLWAQMIAFGPVVFQMTRCLRNFGVLEALHRSPDGLSPEGLREKIDLSEYSLSVLLDGGESAGLLIKEGDRYKLSRAGLMLLADSVTKVNFDFTNDVCYEGAFNLEEALRANEPAGLKVFGDWNTIYEGLVQLPPVALKSWLAFDHFYSDAAFPLALPLVLKGHPKRVLDVGGNTGKFAAACAKSDSEVEVTILDHPRQIELALARAKGEGLEGRVRGVPMNLLDHSVPSRRALNVVWMSQFLDASVKTIFCN